MRTKTSQLKKHWSVLASATLILLLILAYFIIPTFNDLINETWQVLRSGDQERISEYFKNFGVWGPVAILILMVMQMFLIIFPSWLPMIVAVMIYGFWPGVLISVSGVFLASSVGFAIGRYLGMSVMEKLVSKKNFEKMNFWVGHYGFWSVVLFRISPFLSNDAISIVAGMLCMGYRKFITATLIGITPLAVAIAYFSEDTEKLKSGLYWIGGAGILLYGIYVLIDHRKRKK